MKGILVTALSLSVSLALFGCGADAGDTTSGTQGAGVHPEQTLGTDYNNPPEGTQSPAPGPEPGVCVGPTPPAGAADLAPYGNAVMDGMSLDWALTDFQPQSCGYEQTYGMAPFKGRVTVLALLAAW
jgi:hypothetical protein